MVGRSITTVAGAVGVLCMAMAYAGASGFRLDSDEFPIGMFSVDSPGAMAQVARMGVGYVHTYAGGRSLTETELARDRAYLDEAQKNGLKVMFNLNGPVWLKRPDGVAEMLTLVSTFKDHPALGFWYLYDEPDGSCTAAQLKPYYEAIRAATPAIPVAVCTAWSARWTSHVTAMAGSAASSPRCCASSGSSLC